MNTCWKLVPRLFLQCRCRNTEYYTHKVSHRVTMFVGHWRSCTGYQSLIVSSTGLRFWCSRYMTIIVVPCIWVNPFNQPVAMQHVNVFVLSAAKTSLFHGQELSLESEPSLWLVQQYETVCLSLLDQLRLASFKRNLKPICSIFHFAQFLSLITFRMSHRRRKMYCGHMHLRACLSLSMAACPHYCTDTDVTWGSGTGSP